jgi:hypothetical protein
MPFCLQQCRPGFAPALYALRNQFERFFNSFKRFRAVATRCDKSDDNDLAPVHFAAIRICLRRHEPMTWCADVAFDLTGCRVCNSDIDTQTE